MKRTVKLLVMFALAGVLMTYSGCKPKNHTVVPVTDTQIDKLSGTWNISAVTLDGQSKLADYTGFKLTLSGTHGQKTVTYTPITRPALSPWPQGGTFTFDITSPITLMARNDSGGDIPFTYSVTDTQLQLSFTYNGTGFTGGRSEEVKGAWVFTFTK